MFAKKNTAKPEQDASPVVFAEVMPAYPGGEKALFDYLKKGIRYPADAKAKNVQGRVYVTFVVSSKGKILFPHVEKGIGAGCDEEALRAVRSMPLWSPGKQNGKAVPVKHTLPVNFKLN
jgi:protein TonB